VFALHDAEFQARISEQTCGIWNAARCECDSPSNGILNTQFGRRIAISGSQKQKKKKSNNECGDKRAPTIESNRIGSEPIPKTKNLSANTFDSTGYLMPEKQQKVN